MNTHGLFVLGPIVLLFALIDAALRRGALGHEQIRWWQKIVPACVATGLACLFNPYGLRGAIYPLELARTMSNPIFSQSIAELTPIPLFIEKSGLTSLPLQLHIVTIVLGALSFLLPLFWAVAVRMRGDAPDAAAVEKPVGGKSKKSRRRGKKSRSSALVGDQSNQGWRLSPFRVLLFLAFSALSLQATRNSHQFAAVVGSVTAWNFAEWVAALCRLAAAQTRHSPSPVN